MDKKSFGNNTSDVVHWLFLLPQLIATRRQMFKLTLVEPEEHIAWHQLKLSPTFKANLLFYGNNKSPILMMLAGKYFENKNLVTYFEGIILLWVCFNTLWDHKQVEHNYCLKLSATFKSTSSFSKQQQSFIFVLIRLQRKVSR